MTWATSECATGPWKGHASCSHRLPPADGGAESPTSLLTSRLALSRVDRGLSEAPAGTVHVSGSVGCPHRPARRSVHSRSGGSVFVLAGPFLRHVMSLSVSVLRSSLLAWPPLLSFD